jgi:hypothetical protein
MFDWGSLIVSIVVCTLLWGLSPLQFWPVIILFWYRDPIVGWLNFKIQYLRNRFRR